MTIYNHTSKMKNLIRFIFLVLIIHQIIFQPVLGYVCTTPEQWLEFGDISIYYPGNTSKSSGISGKKWPDGIVKYHLNSSLSEEDKAEVYQAFEEYHNKTCIKFEPAEFGDTNYVSIEQNDMICGDAHVCMQGGYQYARFGFNCSQKSTMVHELGHTICLSHLHDRYHQDKTRTSRCIPRSADKPENRIYDRLSQMHVGCNAIGNCGFQITTGLSTLDADEINSMYNCQGCYRHRWIPIEAISPSDFENAHNFDSFDLDSRTLYPCRAYFRNEVSVGKFKRSTAICHIGFGGKEYDLCEQFEVLTIPGGLITKDSEYTLVNINQNMTMDVQDSIFEKAVVAGRLPSADGSGYGNGYIAFGTLLESACSDFWWAGSESPKNIGVIGTLWRYSNGSEAIATCGGKEFKLVYYKVLVCNKDPILPNVDSRNIVPANKAFVEVGTEVIHIQNKTENNLNPAADIPVAPNTSISTTARPITLKPDNRNSKRDQDHGKSDENTTLIITVGVIAGIIVLVLSVSTLYGFIRIRKLKRKLDLNDIKDFFDGQSERNVSHENCYQLQNNALMMPYNRSYEIPKGKIKIEEQHVLGIGQFGCVYKAIIENDQGSLDVALKTTKSDALKSAIKGLLSEIKILIYLGSHPNIVALQGAYTAELSDGIVYLAIELCTRSLESFLRISQPSAASDGFGNAVNDEVSFDEYTVSFLDMIKWSTEIACGMEYLGTKHVIHADLATRNILLTMDKTAKITDFGLSRRMYDYKNYVKTHQEPLPWRWLAIESLKRCEFSAQSDVWSYGVTLWEIFSLGDIPYPGMTWTVDFTNSLVNGLRLDCPTLAPPEIYNIMLDCWKPIPNERPSFTSLNMRTCGLMVQNTGGYQNVPQYQIETAE